MKKTLNIDDELFRMAKSACGARTDTETVRLGLESLVRRAAYEGLRSLRGSESHAKTCQDAVKSRYCDVIEFVRDRNLRGRGIGWVDVHLLASALVSRLLLWTADSRLDRLASELGIPYEL